MSVAPTSGCVEIIQNMLLVMMTFFTVMTGGSQNTPTVDTVDMILEVQITPTVDNFTAEQLEIASEILDARLERLGLLQQPAVIEGDHITLYMNGQPTDALFAVGYLEFVDFSGIDDAVAYNEQTIATDVQIETYGESLQPDAITNPLTGDPFTTILTNEHIAAMDVQPSQFGDWSLVLEFTDAGGAILGDFTQTHIGEPLAIVIDGVVIIAPTIQTRLDSSVVVTGNYTEQEAKNLATQIQTGALPFAFQMVSIDTQE